MIPIILKIEALSSFMLLDMIVAGGRPDVLLAPTAVHDRLDTVTMDLASGVRKAVRCLVALGHRKIGIVNGPLRLESARIRFSAWKEAMAEADRAPEERWAEGGEDWSAETGCEATQRLIANCPELTAIFCANDLLAVGALSALARKGLRVPEDVSLIDFDDTELAHHASPPLTTMKMYSHDMARSAVRRLVEHIENGSRRRCDWSFPSIW